MDSEANRVAIYGREAETHSDFHNDLEIELSLTQKIIIFVLNNRWIWNYPRTIYE